jgi:hypothetical protein
MINQPMRTKIKISDISFVMQNVYYVFIKNVAKEEIKKMKSVDDVDKIFDKLKENFPSFKYQNLKDQI